MKDPSKVLDIWEREIEHLHGAPDDLRLPVGWFDTLMSRYRSLLRIAREAVDRCDGTGRCPLCSNPDIDDCPVRALSA